MKNKNGSNSNAVILEQNKFKEMPLSIINERYSKNELSIEDILQNDDCINDLITKSNSRYKKIITVENIKILIKYCLEPGGIKDDIPQRKIRYPYYSSQILCSQNVLFFQKSIKNLKKNKENQKGNNDENINNTKISEEEKKFTNKSEESNQHYQLEEDFNEDNNYEELYNNNLYQSLFERDEYEKIEEQYVDFPKHRIETDQKSKSKSNKSPTEYDEEDLAIIYDILSEVFKILDLQERNINQTYMGYFQKIVNYLLFNEKDITIKYLFKDNIPIITKFYKNLYSASIQNILENILNLISDLEDNYDDFKNSKYLQIIKDLWNILIENKNLDNFEFICELIINTLINNSEKQLIEFIFHDDYAMTNIKNLIEKIIKENNNDIKLRGIIDILFSLNKLIMNTVLGTSIYKNSDNNLDIFIDEYKKINIFDYQYTSRKNISYRNIFESFQQNELKYSKIINEIFLIIKNNIKSLYSPSMFNINNTNTNIETENGINKSLGLNNLYKWKFILSSLKLYIFSFYIIENKDNTNNEYKKYFEDDDESTVWFIIINFCLSFVISFIFIWIKCSNNICCNNIYKFSFFISFENIVIGLISTLCFFNKITGNNCIKWISYISILISGSVNFIFSDFYSHEYNNYLSISGIVSIAQCIFRGFEIFEFENIWWYFGQMVCSIIAFFACIIFCCKCCDYYKFAKCGLFNFVIGCYNCCIDFIIKCFNCHKDKCFHSSETIKNNYTSNTSIIESDNNLN